MPPRADSAPPLGPKISSKGTIDLVTMKARIWRDETLGAEYDEVEIPEDLLEQAKIISRADDRGGG